MNTPKILVIDDEEDFLFVIKKKLEGEGFEVVTAINGTEGIAKVETEKPNLIVCDWLMPDKNGLEVLTQLRKEKKLRVPFVMLTAYDDFEKIKKAYEGQADFYVPKTINPDELVAKIRTLLNISETRIW